MVCVCVCVCVCVRVCVCCSAKLAWYWRRWDPTADTILDLKPSNIVLQEHREDTVVAVLAHTPA
jgi:hypothetical protein